MRQLAMSLASQASRENTMRKTEKVKHSTFGYYKQVLHSSLIFKTIQNIHYQVLQHADINKTNKMIDLIDMQNQTEGRYKYIGHIVDHFSKFRILFPLETKRATEVAKNCVDKFFSIFGAPTIIQSDNGSEFVNDVIRPVAVLWPGKTRFCNGSVGQSQGLVRVRFVSYLQDFKKNKHVNGRNGFQNFNLL